MPLASAAGVKTSLPAAISAALTNCPAATAAPFRVRDPAAGTETSFTLRSALPGMSFASVNPNAAIPKTTGVSSATVMSPLAPEGASFTVSTSTLALALAVLNALASRR